MTPEITFDELVKLETLIDNSITTRFVGELERSSSGYKPFGAEYVEDVRELLNGLWGAILTQQTIDDAFDRLTECGAAEWPKGFCEEAERESYEEAKLLDAYGDYLVAEKKL
jgi:hypothetical protein